MEFSIQIDLEHTVQRSPNQATDIYRQNISNLKLKNPTSNIKLKITITIKCKLNTKHDTFRS